MLTALLWLLAPPLLAQVAPPEPAGPVPLAEKGIVLDEDSLPPPVQAPAISAADFSTDSTEAARAYGRGDYAKARSLAKVASMQGAARAQLLYAIMLRDGLGGPKDAVQAVHWLRSAAGRGQTYAWLALAQMAFAREGGLSVSDGRDYLQKAAQAGSVEAKEVLGRVFASGLGGPLDTGQAERWFRAAIADGSVRAKQWLGDLLFAAHEDSKALHWYREAAREGDARSAYRAGIILADPQSPLYDEPAARPLLHQAAQAGDAEAMTAWAIMLAHQEPPRPALVARWLRKAAQADDGEGQYLYAVALAKGEGVQMDRSAAYEWAVRAVRHDPRDPKRRALAVTLGQALPGPERDRIEQIAQQPLLILAHTALP